MSKVDFHCSVVNRVPLSFSPSLSLSHTLSMDICLLDASLFGFSFHYTYFLTFPSLSLLSPLSPLSHSILPGWLRHLWEHVLSFPHACSVAAVIPLSHFLPLSFSFSSSSLSLSPLLPSEQDSFSAGHCLQPSKDMKCKKWLRQRYSHSKLEASAAEKAFEARAQWRNC